MEAAEIHAERDLVEAMEITGKGGSDRIGRLARRYNRCMWIGLAAGIALVVVGLYLRWRLEASMERRGPDFVWADVLIFIGLGLAANLSYRIFGEELYPAAGMLGAGLVLLAGGMLMRRKGRRVGWGWPWGFAQSSTRTGRALFLLGLIFTLGGAVLFMKPFGAA